MSSNSGSASPSIAVVDVETTGLFPWRHDRIVEIAIVRMSQDGEVDSEYDSLVNPDRDMGPARIHGISGAEVLHAPKFSQIAGDVLNFLRGTDLIAGHNISFDRNFLTKEYERVGVTLPQFSCLCTYQMMGRSNLKACCEEFGVPFEGQSHRALYDARATAKLVRVLFQEDPSSFKFPDRGIQCGPVHEILVSAFL